MAGHSRRPRRKLSNLVLSEVSLVDEGDNPGARFVLFKRRDEDLDEPTEAEQELFGKAFHIPGQATSAADCPPGWRFVESRQVCVREARLSKQPTSSQVTTPAPLGDRDANERRRRRPRRGRGIDDGSGHLAKLRETLREQATGGRSPHEHVLELPDGPLAAGTFRSERAQDHAHDVQLPDLQPGQSATVESGASIPAPPEGVGPHTHSVRVEAVEVVSSRREDLEKQETKREADQNFPARAFASVPDRESPSTWKLRLFDRVADVGANRPSIVLTAAAATALGPSGFRGQRVQVPSGTRDAVIRRVRAAWLRARRDRDVTRDDLPAVLKGRLEMFDRMVEAITKWAGRAPDRELRKRLFDEVRQDSQREHVVGVLMGRMGDLAVSIREILFDPEGEAGDAERLVKQSLGQFADGIDGELSQIFAGQIVKALADREDPPDHDEVETALEKIFTDSSADPADDEEEGMDLSKLSKEERETLETALDGAGSVEDFLAAAGKIAELEAQATAQTEEIGKLRRAVTGEPEPPEDPLEGLDPEVRKRLEPQLRKANEAATAATKENVDLRKRLDKIEADTARSTFEKSVGDLTGLPQKRDELVEILWKVSDAADRAKMTKNLEAAATAARTGIFTEVGSGLSEGGTAYAQIEAAAEEIRKANPGMTEAVSKAKAMELHPDLYDAYLEEDGGAIN